MFGGKCSADAVTAGVFRIVQEIQRKRPTAKIVLNSILPRGSPGTSVFDDMPAYKEIRRLNQRLNCYASSTVAIDFFNATDLFLAGPNATLVKDLYNDGVDGVHPSPAGYEVWTQSVVAKVMELTAD